MSSLSPFSLPFLNNPRRPEKESLEDSSEEEKQISNQGTDESSSLLATTNDMPKQSSFNIKEQSSFDIKEQSSFNFKEQSSFDIKEQTSFDIKVESEEKEKFGEEIEATVPYVTTTPLLPITNLQMSESDKAGRRKKLVFQ